MNFLSTAFGRKIVYLSVLVAMLVPLFLLGQPAGGSGDSGGRLTEMRDRFNIAESDLGEISPASETMKLASLGLRGVAATLLWNKAHEYRVRHEWDRLKAALNNIALLQPHFDKVWEFQAHNLAYNVSVEFDDYRQRYEMVREGTEFLTRGVRQNRRAPRLVWYTGWFYGQKLGMADEKRQFRRLFADDEVLHESLLEEGIAVDSPEARGPLGKPDNWLVGRLWLNRGYDLVDSGVKIRRQTPLNFYETGPKWRIKHAEAIEKEGILDERAQTAWQMAAEDWDAFGNRSVPTTSPFTIKLGQLDELRRQRKEKIEQLRQLAGDAFEEARQRKVETLPEEQQALLEKPASELTRSEQNRVNGIEAYVLPDFDTVARNADPSERLRAINLAGEIRDLAERADKTDDYREQINYPYWDTLTVAEQEDRTIRARRLIYDAEKANAEAELDKAIRLYEQAFTIWAEIFDDYPVLTIDDTADELYDSVRHYMVATDSEELPKDFPLEAFVKLKSQEGRVDSKSYQEILQMQLEKSAERRQELAEQERRREEAAAAARAEQAAPADEQPNADAAGDEPAGDAEGDGEASDAGGGAGDDASAAPDDAPDAASGS